jgi:hypothetical protein
MTRYGKMTAPPDAEMLGLRALAHVVGDATLGPRLLALTGLDVATLRERASDPQLLAATLAFLEGRESNLVACADALGVTPTELVAARAALEAR